jgi:hypothetical protein
LPGVDGSSVDNGQTGKAASADFVVAGDKTTRQRHLAVKLKRQRQLVGKVALTRERQMGETVQSHYPVGLLIPGR